MRSCLHVSAICLADYMFLSVCRTATGYVAGLKAAISACRAMWRCSRCWTASTTSWCAITSLQCPADILISRNCSQLLPGLLMS